MSKRSKHGGIDLHASASRFLGLPCGDVVKIAFKRSFLANGLTRARSVDLGRGETFLIVFVERFLTGAF